MITYVGCSVDGYGIPGTQPTGFDRHGVHRHSGPGDNGIITVALYLMGRPNEIWDFIDEVVNYLAIIGGVMLAIA